MIFEVYNACSRLSMNIFLSPWKISFCGPNMTLLARTRSPFIVDKHRAKTASPMSVTLNLGLIMHFHLNQNPLTGGPSLQCCNGSPLACTLLTSLIKDLREDWLAIVVLEFENIGGDLDQEGVEDTLIPLEEDI